MGFSPNTHSQYSPYTKCPECGTKIWSDNKKMREWGSMKLHHCILYRTRKWYYNTRIYNPNGNSNNRYSNWRY